MTDFRTQLENELQVATLNVELYKATETVVRAFRNREDYKRVSFVGTDFEDVTPLIKEDQRLFSCGELSISSRKITDFIELAEMEEDNQVKKEWIELREAIAFIEGADWNGAWNVVLTAADEAYDTTL